MPFQKKAWPFKAAGTHLADTAEPEGENIKFQTWSARPRSLPLLNELII